MGPEKLKRERNIDEIRCDGFSLGVTMFEALTLSRPIELPDSVSAFDAVSQLVAQSRAGRGARAPPSPRPRSGDLESDRPKPGAQVRDGGRAGRRS